MNILQINSSARSTGSESTRLADAIVARLTAGAAAGTAADAAADTVALVRRDLATTPHPIIDEATLQALFTPTGQRSAQQIARVAQDDVLIAEIQAADVLVLGAPMYNFGMTVQLKSWFDAIARAQVTFRYTEAGPEGLLKNKKVYVAVARGGMHRDSATDNQVPHLKTILGFLGMLDVQFIYAEGMGFGPEAVLRAQAEAEMQINAVLV